MNPTSLPGQHDETDRRNDVETGVDASPRADDEPILRALKGLYPANNLCE